MTNKDACEIFLGKFWYAQTAKYPAFKQIFPSVTSWVDYTNKTAPSFVDSFGKILVAGQVQGWLASSALTVNTTNLANKAVAAFNGTYPKTSMAYSAFFEAAGNISATSFWKSLTSGGYQAGAKAVATGEKVVKTAIFGISVYYLAFAAIGLIAAYKVIMPKKPTKESLKSKLKSKVKSLKSKAEAYMRTLESKY